MKIKAIPKSRYRLTFSANTNHPHKIAKGGVMNVIVDINTADVFFNIQKKITNASAVPIRARYTIEKIA